MASKKKRVSQPRWKMVSWGSYMEGSKGNFENVFGEAVRAMRLHAARDYTKPRSFVFMSVSGHLEKKTDHFTAAAEDMKKLGYVEGMSLEEMSKIPALAKAVAKLGKETVGFTEGGPKTLRWLYEMVKSTGSSSVFAFDDDSAVLFTMGNHPGTDQILVNIHAYTTSTEVVAWINKIESKLVPREETPMEDYPGPLYLLTNQHQQWGFQHFANFGMDLERGNYTEESLKTIDAIRADLETDYPLGRIAILHGPTGTGKSHVIRSFLRISSCMFVYVQSRFIPLLGDPGLMHTIVQSRAANGKVVFVVEDADSILASRHADNAEAISSLLNAGDGIFSDAMDIRFILTTNLKAGEIDPAITRKGRLSGNCFVDKLPAEQATKVLARLVGEEKASGRFKSSKSLAEVYAEAIELGWERPKSAFSGLRGIGAGQMTAVVGGKGFAIPGHARGPGIGRGFPLPPAVEYVGDDLPLRSNLARQRETRLGPHFAVRVAVERPEDVVRRREVLRNGQPYVGVSVLRQLPQHGRGRGPGPRQSHADGRAGVTGQLLLRLVARLAAGSHGRPDLLVAVRGQIGHDVHRGTAIPHHGQPDADVGAVGHPGEVTLPGALGGGQTTL